MDQFRTFGEVTVVDKDPDAIGWFRGVLEPAGLTVTAYQSGGEFLVNYEPTRGGCLIIEAALSDISGLELQEKLSSKGAHSPIVFVSCDKDVRTIVKAIKHGALDYLQKPVDETKLLQVVRRAIEANLRRYRLDEEHSMLKSRMKLLTRREGEVMEMLFAGNSAKRIATTWGVSTQTVSKHRARLLQKLDVENDVELAHLLMRLQPDRSRERVSRYAS